MAVRGGMLADDQAQTGTAGATGTEAQAVRREKGAAELLGRVAAGDRAAFEELYPLVSAPVYGLALRVVRDPAQAEEVAREALVDVWRLAGQFDPARGGAPAWIMTLTHRRAVDRVRSAQAAQDRDRRAALADPATPFDEVAEHVELRQERDGVQRCLGTLTDIQRQSVTLAYYDGLTYPEVAARLKVPLGTVKTRMRDGLARLRACLEAAW